MSPMGAMSPMSPMRPMGKNTQNNIDSIDSIERKSEAAEAPGDWAGSSPRGSAGCTDGVPAVGYGSGRSPRLRRDSGATEFRRAKRGEKKAPEGRPLISRGRQPPGKSGVP